MPQKIFIGVAWPYANGSLHLGHIAGCYLPADIFARFHRLKGNDVLMVSGSDEHGTPITITAENEHTTPQQIVNRYNTEHTQNMKQFGISFDLFTRTTTKNHETIVQNIFKTLYENKYIYKQTVEAFFCEQCQRFLPDRYIEGTCPHCHDDSARGDQCDTCGKLLDTHELLEVKCKLCGGTPVIKSSDHLFFALSQFEPKLIKWIADKKHWKSNVLRFTENWLKGGLNDRAITRDMQWGISVPITGFEDKRIYVWFDAVIGYYSASHEWSQQQKQPEIWKEWWLNTKAKHYYFLAKDNIPFHSLIWPSILMGYNEKLNLPYDIPANEYLCLSGEQFSKSRCVAIWVPDILKTFDPDAIRYYLSINMPEQKDSNWLWHDFIAKNNDELVGTYGNFIHRVLTFTAKNFNSIPEKNTLQHIDEEALKKIQETSTKVSNALNHCNFKKGLRAAMNLAQYGNYYFDHNQPWTLIQKDRKRCATVLHICLQIVQVLSVYLSPYLPFSSQKIWKQLQPQPLTSWEDAKKPLQIGAPLEKPTPLFKKLQMEEIIMEQDPFSKLDLRTAKILEVKDHPQADKLYVMQIDLGPLGKREIVAGMKPYYTKDEINGKNIVVVINLKPATIRGIESKGMLLAATDSDTGNVTLLNPQDATPGTELTVEGIPREPAQTVEFNEFKEIQLTVGDNQKILYNGKPLKTKTHDVTTDKPVKTGAKVS